MFRFLDPCFGVGVCGVLFGVVLAFHRGQEVHVIFGSVKSSLLIRLVDCGLLLDLWLF